MMDESKRTLAVIGLLTDRSFLVGGEWQVRCSPLELLAATGLSVDDIEEVIGGQSVLDLGLRVGRPALIEIGRAHV